MMTAWREGCVSRISPALPFVHGIPGGQFKRIHLVLEEKKRRLSATFQYANEKLYPEGGWLEVSVTR